VPERGAIARCVPDPARFAREVWSRCPRRHAQVDASAWADVLSLDDVDALIGTGGLRFPALRVVRDGKTLDRSAFTTARSTGGVRVRDAVDPDAVLHAFSKGASVVLQALHRSHPEVQRFCRSLEGFFGHPVQANAYLTPPGARGLGCHHDTHDVLVLQLHGAKRWRLYEAPVPDAVKGHPRSKRHEAPGEPTERLDLVAGDCLYLPRGVPHHAEGTDTISLHLTLGIRSPTFHDVLKRVVAQAHDLPELRASLPLRYDTHPGALEAGLADALERTARWLRERDPTALAADEIERARGQRAVGSVGRLRSMAAGPVGDAVLRRAEPARWTVEENEAHATLRAGRTELRFPARIAPALRLVADRDAVRAADLRAHLDARGAEVLLRRLADEGLLRRPRVD